jgi:hypothetical protein
MVWRLAQLINIIIIFLVFLVIVFLRKTEWQEKTKRLVDACHPFLVIEFFYGNCNISHIMYQC